MMTTEDTTQSKETFTELTAQKLHEGILRMRPSEDLPEEFEVSPNTEREIRAKFSSALYTAPSPNTVLAEYMGMKIIVNEDLPDGTIVIVYRTPQGVRKELKVLNLK